MGLAGGAGRRGNVVVRRVRLPSAYSRAFFIDARSSSKLVVSATPKCPSRDGFFRGLTGALVAAMTAWLQTKQHRALAAAYGVTALELASMRLKIARQSTESDWARFVADAEEAFSREHTLWKASRGVRSI